MTAAVLVISCLLSAAFGALGFAVYGLVKTSLEVRSADLEALKTVVISLTDRIATTESATNTALHELGNVRNDISFHELDLSLVANHLRLKRAS